MSHPPKTIMVIIGFAAVATTLPIFAGYTVSFATLLWLLFTGSWRLAIVGKNQLSMPNSWDSRFIRSLSHSIKPFHWGCFCLVLGHLLAALLGVHLSPWSKPVAKALSEWVHTVVKYGLLWLVVSSGCIACARRGCLPQRVGPWMCLWMLALLIYCIVQHWSGIDWTHGLQATLGSHRFAYGVYRVSGFMGHPLTFAYNLMLIALASLAIGWGASDLSTSERRWWFGTAFLAVLILLISGSRYVILVLLGTLLICEGRRILRHKVKVAALVAVAALLLLWEGSVLARFYELFQNDQTFAQRFPRVVFWQLHWKMFLDNPITGVTRSGVEGALKAYYNAAGYHDTIYEAHNLFLQYLADTGIIGFLGLLGWLIGLFMTWLRLRPELSQGVSYLAVATVFCALMQNNLRDSAYVYALWFFLSILLVQSAIITANQQESATNERESPKNFDAGTRSANSSTHL